MKAKQRTLLVSVAVIAVAMLLFPPFHIVHDGGRVLSAGYSFIGVTPDLGATVNSPLLAIQLGVLAAVTALLWFVIGAPDSDE